MSRRMRPIPFTELIHRALAEYRRKGSIFDIPREHFWRPACGARATIFSSAAANPIGPAAGPHTQLAQNIVSAYLAGARYFELKTVQKLDALDIKKPCIDAADECYNTEWSTELGLEEAYDEYLKAWCALHLFEALLDTGGRGTGPAPPSFLFNMSVGYDLDGIRTERMNRFIDRLIDSSGESLYHKHLEETARLAADSSLLADASFRGNGRRLAEAAGTISPRICGSVTLSTMHGCPPKEIESICEYLIEEKRLDTMVKLNPTLLGFARVREIMTRLGYGYLSLDVAAFEKDLGYQDACPMLDRLLKLGRKTGRHFGVKLSNTLAVANHKGILPEKEMYMSGRALYPLTISLAEKLATDFDGRLPISFCGGVSELNLADVLDAGIRPVTMATRLLKPGGYGLLKAFAEAAESRSGSWNLERIDPERVRKAAQIARESPLYGKEQRGTNRVHVNAPLPLFDCFVAPCVPACPIAQDAPEYIRLAGAGQYEQAFDIVYGRNPLPFMTGHLCDHQCESNCARLDWEGAVRIREIKRIVAERGYDAFVASGALRTRKVQPRGIRVAVLGAGPAGLAASSFLAREGFEVHLFERESEPGGVVRYLLPGFRIHAEAVSKDVSLLHELGVHFHFDCGRTPTIDELVSLGFSHAVVAFGAERDLDIGIEGAWTALAFLRKYRKNPAQLKLGRSVAVIGAGDTAMDAARAAVRCQGVEEVRIIYRRSECEMPASREEFSTAVKEGVLFHFLRMPEAWEDRKTLVCRVMELTAPDETGRSRPIPTSRTEVFSVTTVIAAVGARPDADALERIGLGPGLCKVDPETQETKIKGVFLVGDAAGRAETIVKAIASARKAADAICSLHGGSRFTTSTLPTANHGEIRGRRDRSIPASVPGVSNEDAEYRCSDDQARKTESLRCLDCGELCIKCVEVCPNRANTFIAVSDGFRDNGQIVHLDAFCNECGNCATFCPWDGRPYLEKLTLYSRMEHFRSGTNPGFHVSGEKCLLRIGSETREFALDDPAEDSARKVIRTIVASHPYLLGPVG